jgi:hypothetical protein
MAITEIEFPSGTNPALPEDYVKHTEVSEDNAVARCSVSLSNWDSSTTIPAVKVGSRIECNGALYKVDTSDSAITVGSVADGTVYIVFDPSVPEFLLTATAPSWSDSLQGYYSGTYRFTGYLMTKSSSSYTDKKRYVDNDRPSGDSIYITAEEDIQVPNDVDGDLTVDGWVDGNLACQPGAWTYWSHVETSLGSGEYYLPKGVVLFRNATPSGTTSAQLRLKTGVSTFTPIYTIGAGDNLAELGTFISSGENLRVNYTVTSGTYTLDGYVKTP